MRIALEGGVVVERAFSPGSSAGCRAGVIEMEQSGSHGFAALADAVMGR